MGVVDGEDWDRRLAVFAADERRRADEAERDGQDSRAEHLRRDADRAEQLAAFVGRLRDDSESLASAGSWADMAQAAHGLIGRYLGGERQRWRWPEEEQQAAERVEEILDRLAALDEVGGPPPTVEVFRRTLDGELEVSLPRLGHFGDGVLIGPVSMGIGIELDRIAVLGLAEGAFPPRRLEDSLLHDDERRAAAGELALRADRVHDDHRHLLVAVAAAAETTLFFPRGDLRRQGDRSASRWLLADAARLADRDAVFTADLSGLDADWFRQVPSYAAGLARLTFPATAQDVRLAAMLRDPNRVIAADRVLALGVDLAHSRRSAEFTRFDGNLTGLDLPDYTAGAVTSATRLQAWAECPHAFLLEYLLGVEVVEDVERRLEMDPLDKGSLIHEILDRFVVAQIAAGRSGPWSGTERTRLLEIAEDVFADYGERGATGRAMFWRRDRARILADLEQFAVLDDGHPVCTEFGFTDVEYPLAGGRAVRLRGSIDRVDDTGPGSARVTDYKTGSTRRYDGLDADDPHQGGSHLQLAMYGLAVQQRLDRPEVDTGYWFVSEKGKFARIGYLLSPHIQSVVGEAVATIVDGIRSGISPSDHRPTRLSCGSTAGIAPRTGRARRRLAGTGNASDRTRPFPITCGWSNRRPSMTPSDTAARQAVRDRLDETLFVEAGAGSGKTTCLVERFVNLVEAGVDADRIAAITFTEKAAGELVDRIRNELQKRSATSARCRAALPALDGAAICTLHAFALRLLSEHPIEARLPLESLFWRRSRRSWHSRPAGTASSTGSSRTKTSNGRSGCCWLRAPGWIISMR